MGLNPLEYHPPGNGYWRVPDVSYRGKTNQTFDLLHGLLPVMTQERAIARTRAAKPGDFVHADLPLYFAVFSALEQLQKKLDVSAPVAFLQKSMRENCLMTLTGVEYAPEGEDMVTHGVGTKNLHQQKANVVGPDRQITQEDGACLEALLGTGDVSEVGKVLQFINGTPIWIWRVNSRPREVATRVVRLYANSDGVDLDCNWDPQGSNPAFGVRRVA